MELYSKVMDADFGNPVYRV